MKRKELTKLAEKIKNSGFRVFIPKKEDYNWIIFSNKNNIFYTEGIDVSIKYRSSRRYGDSCLLIKDFYGNVEGQLYNIKTKNLQELCDFIPFDDVEFYKNIDDFIKETWTEYTEI